MKARNFLRYVEIQTKVASSIPFLLGTLFAVYRYNEFHYLNFLIMFISLLSFDMATTAINNYMDYKKAIKDSSGLNKEFINQSIIVKGEIGEKKAVDIIIILLLVAVIFGIILTMRTGILVLLIGILSFVVGVLYTFGPIPISRMPLGEVFSGFFMGFVIMFLAIYIEAFDKNIITIAASSGMLTININIREFIYIFLISVPAIGGIANIMLANNICDIDEDIINKRFTLPYYIGRKNALKLFKALYYIGYIDVILLVSLGIAPIYLLVILITFMPVKRAIDEFTKKQLKVQTFILSVKNFILMSLSQVVVMLVVVLIRYFLN